MDRNEIKRELKETYQPERSTYRIDGRVLRDFFKKTRQLLLLDFDTPNYTEQTMDCLLDNIEEDYLRLVYPFKKDQELKADDFLSALPSIRRSLLTSLEAILEGDPAAENLSEIVYTYPGFEAILYYRIAHEFYLEGYKLLARRISEDAHSKTGIDINPGAKIGDYFFIDHGTGIVIGETTIIGSHVKLYQGVTLGAKSLGKGRGLVGVKRHPTVEDSVTIYSNASILGGNTVIGHDSTIGSSVYLTDSVEPYSLVILGDSGIKISKKNQH